MKKHVLFTRDQIAERIKTVSEIISQEYAGGELILIGILKGAFIFMADLVRLLRIPVKVDFVRLASYGSSDESSGIVTFTKDMELAVQGKDILLIEDIVDTGHTIRRFKEIIETRNPRSVRICTLVSKTERRKVAVAIDYACFEVERGFLVGYGLDYDESHRGLPDIYRLEIPRQGLEIEHR